MEGYNFVRHLGDGAYGTVNLARCARSHKLVAIKQFKQEYHSWQEVVKLAEVRSLRALAHDNIVKLLELFRQDTSLYLVFEFMDSNLYELIKKRSRGFGDAEVAGATYQVLKGLAFMHRNGYFHRDLKPENILCKGLESIKLADFGLAKEIRARPPFTEYISTRWYRAPEILIRSRNYNSPIDMWAIGAIMAELYTLRAIFPGTSEIDQMFKVCSILGAPTKESWPEGLQIATTNRVKFPQMPPTSMSRIVPNASREGILMMNDMLHWDPKRRVTAPQALARYYFAEERGKVPKKEPVSEDTQREHAAQPTPPTRPVIVTRSTAAHQAAATVSRKVEPAVKEHAGTADSDDEFEIEWASPPKKTPVQQQREQQREPGKRMKWGQPNSPGSFEERGSPTVPSASKSRPQRKDGQKVADQTHARQDQVHRSALDDYFGDVGASSKSQAPKGALARKESTLSTFSNFSLAGEKPPESAKKYYASRTRFSPGATASPVKKYTFVPPPDTGRFRQPQAPAAYRGGGLGKRKASTEQFATAAPGPAGGAGAENKWRSKPSYTQLDPGRGKRASDAGVPSDFNATTLLKPKEASMPRGISVGKSSHRTNWAAKYGK